MTTSKPQQFFFVLIKPPIKCSTREIYSKIKKYSSKTVFNKKAVKKRISFLNLLIKSKNDLQSVVEKKYPRLKTILNNISLQLPVSGQNSILIPSSSSIIVNIPMNNKSLDAAPGISVTAYSNYVSIDLYPLYY